jgi:hypothetical protein
MAEKPTLQVKGNVDLERYKAARTLAGDDVKFELRAMRQAPGSSARGQISCLICIICIICIVCTVANASAAGTKLPPL